MLEKIQETAAFLKGKMHTSPETAIILGTGLGSLANEITEKYEIKYEDIPNFPVSTVEGHSGKLFSVNWVIKRLWQCRDASITTRLLYERSDFPGTRDA